MIDKEEVLKRPVPKDPKDRPAYFLKQFLNVLLTIVLVIMFIIGALLIFHNSYFTMFYVNGVSMYPTLNENALDRNGKLINANSTGSFDGYTVEFGIMDTTERAINNIERGDIIISYFAKDYDANGNLRSSATTKIKRVIGIPGDTIDLKTNGEIYVNDELFVCDVDIAIYPITLETFSEYTYSHCQLTENQYYLVGDNRIERKSSDSRQSGPVEKEYIVGVAVAIEGTCVIKGNECTHKRYHWPRFF